MKNLPPELTITKIVEIKDAYFAADYDERWGLLNRLLMPYCIGTLHRQSVSKICTAIRKDIRYNSKETNSRAIAKFEAMHLARCGGPRNK